MALSNGPDAMVFDLDGVITFTASLHAAAWKELFDSYLEQRAKKTGGPFVPFDANTDYLQYVDGKPRYDGVASFRWETRVSRPQLRRSLVWVIVRTSYSERRWTKLVWTTIMKP